ncbi:MAG: PAS domain-containing protein, partial [Acidobacteria bacterium]|nr:PAS domain-containing protein [Acidobacteriota bacterium]
MSRLTTGNRKRTADVRVLPPIGRIETAPRSLLDSIPLLIASIDRDLKYRYVNRKYGEWFGLLPGRIRGRLVRD